MRYLIGIDLGTTNSCVSYIDTREPQMPLHMFKIPQLVAAGAVDALPTLPSFCYLAAAHEWTQDSLSLPWKRQSDFFVGAFARDQGAKVPTRLVQSAKSWLCHSSSHRRDKILPVDAADESARISPTEATARYLRHIRDAWNHAIAKGVAEDEFDSQEVVLTVPASFDEVARALTIEAAQLAGFSSMTLLEEPQAAFYSWIAQHERKWETLLKEGTCVLVCDIGGGTTDFSLIEVVATDGQLAFQRMAVGDHLLLGGDNMDAAIAHLVEEKLTAKGCVLDRMQQLQVRQAARQAKEMLLGADHAEATYKIVLHGTGAGVVQGTISTEISAAEVTALLLEGFFGLYSWEEALRLRKATGLRTMGLPYESEPSITKHLAAFLSQSGKEKGEVKRPDAVLFNGGATKPSLFQKAIVEALQLWFPEKQPAVLPSYNLDLAVARGAAYYAKARQGLGVRIGGGSAHGYYLVLDVKAPDGGIEQKALTLLPRGSEEGASYEPEQTFRLKPNMPVSFQLCTSHVRLYDVSGDIVAIDPLEMQILPPIHTILRVGKGMDAELSQESIPVHVRIRLTPIGTLEIGLRSLTTQHDWSLAFQVRSSSGKEDSLAAVAQKAADQTFQAGFLKDAEAYIQRMFSSERGDEKLVRLMEKLEEILEMPRREWPLSVMRGLADAALKAAPQRKLGAESAARWWNLVGFLLRPGYGYALDDFRAKELWKTILSDFKAPLPAEVQLHMWICYRRIAGGMSKGQQLQLANDLLSSFLSKKNWKIELKSKAEAYPYSEKVRAVAAMELIDTSLKVRIGDALVSRICSAEGMAAEYWALGRLGARHLLYGSLAYVIPREVCVGWIERLLQSKAPPDDKMAFLMGQLARKTGHRELNVPEKVATDILAHFAGTPYHGRLEDVLLKENHLNPSEQEQAFGDKLPAGLQLDIAP